MKKLMSEYQNMYAGRPAAVLGGGPSLPDDMRRLPNGCLLIAVNFHALQICRPIYMVYNDQPESDPQLLEAVLQGKVLRVSPDPSSDILFDLPVWTGFYSSNTAAWFAGWLGCDPILLCGMDCYQGDQVYFHPWQADCPTYHYPLEHHLRPWIEDGRKLIPHVERVRAMSGPLVNVFGGYA
jgi:hypothetical protein